MKSIYAMSNVLFGLGLFVFSGVSFAAQTGTVTFTEGTVKLFSHPSKDPKSLKGPAPHAKFEGTYYSVTPLEIGNRVTYGNILTTSPGAKARIIYDNGDQISVGPGTSLRLTARNGSQLSLDYGKVRAVVSKKGPRRRLRVKTRTATMGVRGTDFYVSDKGWEGKTTVSVLRGKVNVASEVGKKVKKEVTPGFKAEISEKTLTPKQEKVQLGRINQVELVEIQKVSSVREREIASMQQSILKERIDQLELKAKEMTLGDIKDSDPKLYQEIQKGGGVLTAHTVNTQVVKTLFDGAPKGGKSKPGEEELKDLEQDAYKKYFKVD